ncbi:MAG: ABC transporter ATP-binding protein [Xanthomonadaceae bacterium]|jgi:lipopolysaccharide transport system ATP-binding protein|nr:ABC transporter ATP-binding protein [Xanthomonadaceae bacterium]
MTAHIRARGLTLDVPIFLQRETTRGGWLGMYLGAAFAPPRRSVVRLLDRISLDVADGDRLAILGRNGAGKSTLLRVLNRVYQPTSGRLDVQGSCQALLNMSLGFNGEATVRENVFLRGVAMGLHSSFLRQEMDSILEFAGLREKVNHRLRTLSSGQRLRLGFAISTSVQHDIILMDEWLGTGDANFMARAKERMRSRVDGSRIVVLASHSVGLLRDICNKGIVLERGRLIHAGDIGDALQCYHDLMARLRRGEEVELDEPAGEESAHVFGAVEELRAEARGRFLLKGWMVDGHGGLPTALVVEWQGQRFAARVRERILRRDVMRHFGLADGTCGFLAEVELPGAGAPADLGAIRVLGGHGEEQAHGVLRIAAPVQAALEAPAGRPPPERPPTMRAPD